MVDRPQAVVTLPREQLGTDPLRGISITQAEKLEEEQVLRRDRHVRLELADPPSARFLKRQQPVNTPLDAPLDG